MGVRLAALGRLSSFVLTTGMSSLASILTVYVIIPIVGGYQWGVQSSIQSAAGLFGVLVAFGWGTTGAAETASMPAEDRPGWYAGSLVSRIYLFCLAYPIMVLVMALLNRNYFGLVVVGSAAYLLPSLGASWYFVGEARPSRLFRYDALPQTIGMILSIGTMLATHSLVATIGTQLVLNACAPVISAFVILRRSGQRVHFDWSVRHATQRLVGQRHPVATAATSSLYVSTPMLVLNALHPAAMPLYAMGDKLFRFGLTAFAPVLQFVQGWIPEGGVENIPHRIKQTGRLTPLISALGAACIFAFGPWAARMLASSQVDFGFDLSLPFAFVFLAVSVTQVLGLACLVQLHRTRALATSTVVGALTGVPMIVVGAWLAAAHGVAWALAVSEVVVLIYQVRTIVRELGKRHG